jgi:hypothetical protein
MRAIGARSVPIVARGDRFVYAQSIADVAAFVGIAASAGALDPAALVARGDAILAASGRHVRQFTEPLLAEWMPNRPNRTNRVLAHHAFNVVETLLESSAGDTLIYETLVRPPPVGFDTAAHIAAYGEHVRQRFGQWRNTAADRTGAAVMKTY